MLGSGGWGQKVLGVAPRVVLGVGVGAAAAAGVQPVLRVGHVALRLMVRAIVPSACALGC